MSKSKSSSRGKQGRKETQTAPIGYGKPPKEHQFQPGQSGNPSGRPKKRRTFETQVRDLFTRKLAVRDGEKVKNVSVLEVALLKLVERVTKGEHRALEHLFKLASEYEVCGPRGFPITSKMAEKLDDQELEALDRIYEKMLRDN